MFRELVEHKVNNRGLIVPVGNILPSPADYCRYCSMFMFGSDIQTYVSTNKSVKGFKGKIYSDAIWIDIDSDNLNEAQEIAITVVKRLNADYQINPECLFIYFSGGKGFHIAIFSLLIGFSQNEPVTAEKVKDFVRRITVNIPKIDLAIYEPVRLFRVENSKHEKTGLYKTRISFEELQCEIDDIKKLAKYPRAYPYKLPAHDFKTSEELKKVWINSGAYTQEIIEADGKLNFFSAPRQGNRNNTLLKQACLLFRKSELSSNAVLDIIRNAAELSNIGASDPLGETEIKQIVRNAEKLVGEDRKKQTVEELQIRSIGEWMPEWERYHLMEQSEKTMIFSELNQVLKGRLRGKMAVVMGYGGSKKSLLALNIVQENSTTEEVAAYSNMEMGIPQFIDRVIDMRIEYKGYNSHEAVVSILRKDLNGARDLLKKDVIDKMGNRLQVIANGRMTYETYKAAIRKLKDTIGDVWCLIVDGLSMMGGKGTETELYSQNSADLKQLANEENLFIIVICHVSKGGEKWTRDLSRQIRGSEKILDNCDFYMTMSQIQEEGNTDHFRNDIGFLHFHDKRGTGKTVEVVYKFDPYTLKLSDSGLEPALYYEPFGKKNGKKDELSF